MQIFSCLLLISSARCIRSVNLLARAHPLKTLPSTAQAYDLREYPQENTRSIEEVELLPPILKNLLKPWPKTLEDLEPVVRDLHSIEVFAGEHWITRKVNELGMQGLAFDVKLSPQHDIFTRQGFLEILKGLLSVEKWGMCWGAPVCSSWGWIGRSSIGRCVSSPQGSLSNPTVWNMNIMVQLWVTLALIA